VSIRIWEMKDSGISRNARADFRSASRVGLWDLGQNGRNLRELVSAIDRKLIADH
jgi:uncharacterized protein (DUF1499 family)